LKKLTIDYRLIIGLVIAHLFMYFSFQNQTIFWYMFTATMLLLMSYSILSEKMDHDTNFLTYSMYGLLSGILLYFLFWLGHFFIDVLNLPFQKEITKLYKLYSPTHIWQYLVLLCFIVPGEEFFWRGFVQNRLSRFMGNTYSILIGALLYASVQIYSGTFIHIFSALFAGLFWGFLYSWKKSIPLVVVSHLIFDLFIFILFPFR
jgi:membrane protease YdiL (CAAX protease family)